MKPRPPSNLGGAKLNQLEVKEKEPINDITEDDDDDDERKVSQKIK
jgi:hypothetical protein